MGEIGAFMSQQRAQKSRVQEKDTIKFATPKQRALIFQGGGALGAYEAGVYRVLYDWIFKNIISNKRNENLFDVIAGTSIGAINGAIILSHILEKKNQDTGKSSSLVEYWRGSADRLEQFWHEIETRNFLTDWFDLIFWPWDIFQDINKKMKESWNTILTNSEKIVPFNLNNNNPFVRDWFELLHFVTEAWDTPASRESARRYWTTRILGSPNVAAPVPRWDFKFWDNLMGFRLRLEQSRLPFYWLYPSFSLKESCAKYIPNPIKTHYKRQEPRFLLVSVDVQSGDTVWFDSYDDATRYNEYSEEQKKGSESDKEEEKKYDHVISYPKGIEWDQLRTTFSMPGLYRYAALQDQISGRKRTFWDGGVLSNTPLREVIDRHKDYWSRYIKEKEEEYKLQDEENAESNKKKEKSKIPSLDVYIADVWPAKLSDYPVPSDNDFVASRMTDLMLLDKTQYEEAVTKRITDYMHLIEKLIDLSRSKGATDKDIDGILNLTAKSTLSTNKEKQYRELLENMLEIERVMRIERKDELYNVSYVMADFSPGTMRQLLEQGKYDTLDKLIRTLLHTMDNLDKSRSEDDKSDCKPALPDTKNILYTYLNKAREHLLIKENDCYEKVMGHLNEFVDEVNRMESDGRLDPCKANLLRP